MPKAGGAGWSFQKFNRRAQDWAIVGVACVRNGTTGIGLVNMGSTPLRGAAVEDGARLGRVDRGRGRGRRTRAPIRRPTSTPPPSTAAISPASSSAAPSTKPPAEAAFGAGVHVPPTRTSSPTQ